MSAQRQIAERPRSPSSTSQPAGALRRDNTRCEVKKHALDALEHAAGPGAGDTELLSVLTVGEGAARRLDLIAVRAVAALQRRAATPGCVR